MRTARRLPPLLLVFSLLVGIGLVQAPSGADEQFLEHTEVHLLTRSPGCITRVGNIVGTINGFWHSDGCIQDGAFGGSFLVQSTISYGDHVYGTLYATIASVSSDGVVQLDGAWRILGGNGDWKSAAGWGTLVMTLGARNTDDLRGQWNGPFAASPGEVPPCLVCPG